MDAAQGSGINTLLSLSLSLSLKASKQVVDSVVEEAQKVEAEKQKAIEARCSVSMEIASRPYKVADQRSEFERMREKLEVLFQIPTFQANKIEIFLISIFSQMKEIQLSFL